MFPGWPNKQEGGGVEETGVKKRTERCRIHKFVLFGFAFGDVIENSQMYMVLFTLLSDIFATVLKHYLLWLWGVFKLIIVLRWTEFSTFVLQAIRLSLEQALPPEPSENSGKQISKLRIRTPSGEFLERRFLGSCNLQVLFDFVASKGYPFEEFKLLTTFPRRNVSSRSL